MSLKPNKSMPAWWIRIRKHPIIAALIVLALVVGGLAKFIEDVGKIWIAIPGISKKVSIIDFGLSPSSHGYEDIAESIIFGASENRIRTFQPIYPFVPGPRAVLLFSVDNPNKEDLIIKSLTYDIEDVGAVKGGQPGPLNPLACYHHTIRHQKGPQQKTLRPVFRVPEDSAESFEVEISSSDFGHGLGWVLRIIVNTNLGKVETEKFQIYLPEKDLQTGDISNNTQTCKDHERNEDEKGQKQDRISIIKPIRSHKEALDLYERVGALSYVQELDTLDKDLLLLRARIYSFDEFADFSADSTDPPAQYRDLMPSDLLNDLWREANRYPLQL